jgi:hypothetical protein
VFDLKAPERTDEQQVDYPKYPDETSNAQLTGTQPAGQSKYLKKQQKSMELAPHGGTEGV